MKRRTHLISAAFTVEAAMLMAVILPVLMAILTASFDLHDRALFQGAVSEALSMGGNLVLYEEERAALPGLIGSLMQDGTIRAEDLSAGVSADPDYVSASCSGTIDYPFFLEPFAPSGSRTISASGERTILHPASLIWKVRGIRRVVSALNTS